MQPSSNEVNAAGICASAPVRGVGYEVRVGTADYVMDRQLGKRAVRDSEDSPGRYTGEAIWMQSVFSTDNLASKDERSK